MSLQTVQVAITATQFVNVYARLNRKPDLIPVSQSLDASDSKLVFILRDTGVPMSVILRADGTWNASADIHI